MPINSNVFSALSCTSFKVLGLILSSLIHFELVLVQGKRHGSSFSFLHVDIPFFLIPFFLTLFSPLPYATTRHIIYFMYSMFIAFLSDTRSKSPNVGSGLKPVRTGHKQGKMQLVAFTYRPK
jgi:hypothetical protein